MVADSTEYCQLIGRLQDPDSGLDDVELLDVARRLTILRPDRVESWWAVANQANWMLRALCDAALRTNPIFAEMIRAYDRVMEVDKTDVAGPYNKARNLRRAGLLDDAYRAFVLAGRTEAAHPGDVEWPAAWHFEQAAEVALELGHAGAARDALNEAVELCGPDDPDVREVLARIGQSDDSLMDVIVPRK